MTTAKEEIESLRAELEKHNYNYYVLSQPTISDFEFDQKLKSLQQKESAHPEYYDPNPNDKVTIKFETVERYKTYFRLIN